MQQFYLPASMRRSGLGNATALTALVTALKLCTSDATVVESTPGRGCVRALEGTGAGAGLGAARAPGAPKGGGAGSSSNRAVAAHVSQVLSERSRGSGGPGACGGCA